MKTIPVLQYKELLCDIGKFAESKKISIWVVGGCVRDWYLKRGTKDIDLITEVDANDIADFICHKFKGEKESFENFGTFRIKLSNGLTLDIARTRKETYPKPASLPKVSFSNIEQDLHRRDFTVNSAAISILPSDFGTVYDPFKALQDIDGGIIKVLHKESFVDDPTRLYRACRFAGRFGWKLDDETLKLAQQAVADKLPSLLSRSRIARELVCILQEKNPIPAFKLLEKFDLTKFFDTNFKYTNKILKVKDSDERIGVLACNMGNAGIDFLKSLELKRETFLEIQHTLQMHITKMASKQVLTRKQKNILKASNKNLPRGALKPLIINGKDIERMSNIPKKDYSAVLDEVANLQWRGKVTSLSQVRFRDIT